MEKELSTAIKIAGKVIDNWLPLKIMYDHTPGAVVCIAANGAIKYVNAFGFSDLERGTRMKKDAQFRVASMSKMFTAVSILQLQEKGKLRLDDTVSSHLAWFKGKAGKTDLSNVTIRQLLSHNAGLFRDGRAKQWINDRFPEKLDDTISAKSIIFENATTLKYSNHGYAVLGALIEKTAKQSFGQYVTKYILKPLGLNHTLPDLPDDIPSKLVQGYKRWLPGEGKRQFEPHIKTNAYASATGFISSTEDLAKFLATLHPDAKKSVLGRESRKAMQQVQGIVNQNEMYGLGLSLESVSGQETYGHSGGFAGYITNAISHSDDNIQVIVLTNTISSTAGAVSDNIMRLIYRLKDMKDVVFIAKEPYSGTYRDRWGDSTIVSLGKKLVEFRPSTANPVEAWSELEKQKQGTFRNTDKTGFGAPGERVTFKKIVNGKAQVMSGDWGDSIRV